MRRLLLAALLLGCIAAAPPDPRAQFEDDLAAWRVTAAGRDLEAIIEASYAKSAVARSDPEINLLAGRYLLRAGHPQIALGFLRHAGAPELSVELAMLVGEAQLYLGNYADALPLLALVEQNGSSPALRAEAARGRVEALLATDPRAAAVALEGESTVRASDAAHEWAWRLYDAQAALLLSRDVAAQSAADRGWAAASRAELTAFAPRRIAAMLGVLAARAGARDRAIGLLATASGSDSQAGDVARQFRALLPLCGAIVKPDDQIVVALYPDDRADLPRIAPLWASRPDIVASFLDGLNAARLLETPDMKGAVITLALRCRTSPDDRMLPRHDGSDLQASWSAEHGAYPQFDHTILHEGDQLVEVARRLDALERQVGPQSPRLLGTLAQLREVTARRVMYNGDIPPSRVTEVSHRLSSILAMVGGADGFAPPGADPGIYFAMMMARTEPAVARRTLSENFRNYLTRADLGIAYESYLGMSRRDNAGNLDRNIWLPPFAQRVRNALAASDPRRVGLTLAEITLAREHGNYERVHQLFGTLALPADLCLARDTEPQARGNGIVDSDFPVPGILTSLQGRSVLEFDLDASGRHTKERVIVSAPAYLFDDVIAQRIGSIAYAPATIAGRSVPCRGLVQSIEWSLPGDRNARPYATQNWQIGT